MARAHYVKKASKDIYVNGRHVTYTSKKGKRAGQEKSKLDRTLPADQKDTILIPKGTGYYWWQFKNSNKTYSLTPPKRSQLTRSGYLSQLYDLQDRLSSIRDSVSDADDLQGEVDNIKSDIENLRDECQSSLDNMPEHLQESSSSGELLRERIDALENVSSELESIDCEDYEEPDEDDIREELKDNVDDDDIEKPEEGSEELEDWDEDEARKKAVTDEMIDERKQELLDEWLDEKCDEISNISFD